MVGLFFAFHYHIINIGFDILSQSTLKHSRHHSLVHGVSVHQSEWHYSIMVVSRQSEEDSFLLIRQRQGDLVISLKSVQETHPRMSKCCIHQLIYSGNRNGSFGQALLRSVKSIHTSHFPDFFFTTIVLANHSKQKTSLIALAYCERPRKQRPLKKEILVPFRALLFLGKWYGVATYFFIQYIYIYIYMTKLFSSLIE